MQDLVSIIIPCYNASKTIFRTLFSVLEQDYENLEIIVIDDGSKDDSLPILKQFEGVDRRIKILSQKNSGVSVARNTGLSIAQGKYIVFLDADDNYTAPNAISKMVFEIKNNNADMCVCNFKHPCFEITTQGNQVFDLKNKESFYRFYQDFFLFGMPWNKITKRQCLTEKFVEGVKFNEDELYNLDNFKNLNRVVFLDEVLHNYYCAPYNPNEPASAVNSIYLKENFWEQKSTIWHMGMKNHEYRLKSINRFFESRVSDMQYIRSFDFFFWDLLLMLKNDVNKKWIVNTCKSIFETDLFQKTLKDKERFGFKLIDFPENKIDCFIELSRFAFEDIKTGNKNISIVRVLMSLFAVCFYTCESMCNNEYDLLKTCFNEMVLSTTDEGKYVKKVIKYYE